MQSIKPVHLPENISNISFISNRNQSLINQDEQDSNLLLVPGIMNAPRTPGAESGQVTFVQTCLL